MHNSSNDLHACLRKKRVKVIFIFKVEASCCSASQEFKYVFVCKSQKVRKSWLFYKPRVAKSVYLVWTQQCTIHLHLQNFHGSLELSQVFGIGQKRLIISVKRKNQTEDSRLYCTLLVS